MLRLHHTAFRVQPGKLHEGVQILKELGLVDEFPTGDRSSISFAGRGQTGVQLIETLERIASPPEREHCHIAFVHEEPERIVRELAGKLEIDGIRAVVGSWSPREWWLDCPDVFADAVIEVMMPPS